MVACLVSAALGFTAAELGRPWSTRATAHEARAEARAEGGPPLSSVHTTGRLVALTFDDGPDPRWTPEVLDLLRRSNASATFFVTGLNAVAHSDLVGAEVNGGNEIGDHTWSHPDLRTLAAPAIESEIVRGGAGIRAAGAPAPQLFRPPYGESDDAVAVVADAEGYRTVLWSLALEHYVDHTPDLAGGVEALLDRVHPGSIILAHDGGVPNRGRTLQALPLLLAGLKAQGYRVVDVSTLLAAARTAPSPLRG